MFMAIGQCGSVLGSHIYPSTEGPRYMYVYIQTQLKRYLLWKSSKGFAGGLSFINMASLRIVDPSNTYSNLWIGAFSMHMLLNPNSA